MRRLRSTGDDRGFTLVEVIVVVMLLGVVSAVFSSSVIRALQAERRTAARADVQFSVTLGMDRLTKQVRVAAPLIAVSATSVTADTYSTATGADVRTRYTYVIDVAAGTLSETRADFASVSALTPSSTSTRVLTRGLTAGSITAFKRNGNLRDPAVDGTATVASLLITLTGTAKEGRPHTAKTTVFLRNFKG